MTLLPRGKIFVGDIGTVFELEIRDQDNDVVDISTASVKKMKFRKPDGTVVTNDASFSTDGTDGKIRWTTDDVDDLDQAGDWSREGYVELSSGKWHTTIVTFRVHEHL